MTNYSVGHDAEKKASGYLASIDYKILELNWKTKYCEIDIIAQKNNTLYFVEVKYRNSPDQGSGFEYITSKKLKQMIFAAENYVNNSNWEGEYQLSAISIDGDNLQFVKDIL